MPYMRDCTTQHYLEMTMCVEELLCARECIIFFFFLYEQWHDRVRVIYEPALPIITSWSSLLSSLSMRGECKQDGSSKMSHVGNYQVQLLVFLPRRRGLVQGQQDCTGHGPDYIHSGILFTFVFVRSKIPHTNSSHHDRSKSRGLDLKLDPTKVNESLQIFSSLSFPASLNVCFYP